MVGMREAIAEKQFADFKEQVKKDWLRVGDSAAM
jgi:queuine/archaeosine tRNA-ribosyltransferase